AGAQLGDMGRAGIGRVTLRQAARDAESVVAREIAICGMAEDQPLALRRRKTTGKRGVQRRDALLCGSGIGAIGGFVLRVERRQPFGDGAEPKCGIGRIEPGMGVGVAVIMGIAVIMTFGLG